MSVLVEGGSLILSLVLRGVMEGCEMSLKILKN